MSGVESNQISTSTPGMRLLSRILSGVQVDQTFYLNGKRYWLRGAGRRALRLLDQADFCHRTGASMLELRPTIETVLLITPPGLLSYVVENTESETKLRMAIWILGRSKASLSKESIFAHRDHAAFKVRCAVVRALFRLEAWQEIARILETSNDPNIRRLAAGNPKPEFEERLKGFMRTVKRQSFDEREQKLVVSSNVTTSNETSAKSGWLIRRFLRRIRILAQLSSKRRGYRWPFREQKNLAPKSKV